MGPIEGKTTSGIRNRLRGLLRRPFSHVLTLRQDCERMKQDGVKLKEIY